ncbi:MAG: hypothetical protein WBY44_12530 [Bryobacteraceae bacterium]
MNSEQILARRLSHHCVVGGQKIPLQRPRVRDTRQVPLGSYELLQRASVMEESVY